MIYLQNKYVIMYVKNTYFVLRSFKPSPIATDINAFKTLNSGCIILIYSMYICSKNITRV